MAEENSIAEAVASAAESLSEKSTETDETVDSQEVETEEVETEEVEEKEDEVEDQEETTDDKEDEETEEETEEVDEKTANALKVWEALNNDPVAVLKHFAKQAGVEVVVPNESIKEEQVVSIKDIVADKLGTDYAFLADKIGDAIESVLEQKVTPKFQEEKTLKDAEFVESKITSLMSDDKLGDKDKTGVANNMAELFKVLPGNYNNQKELDLYIGAIYTLASKDVKKSAKLSDEGKRRVKRQKQNLEDEDPSSVAAGDFSVKRRPRDLTHRQAVEAALQGVQYAD